MSEECDPKPPQGSRNSTKVPIRERPPGSRLQVFLQRDGSPLVSEHDDNVDPPRPSVSCMRALSVILLSEPACGIRCHAGVVPVRMRLAVEDIDESFWWHARQGRKTAAAEHALLFEFHRIDREGFSSCDVENQNVAESAAFARNSERRLVSRLGIEPRTRRLRERVAGVRLCPRGVLASQYGLRRFFNSVRAAWIRTSTAASHQT